MKGDHRKELGTNVLADSLGKAVQSVKDGKRIPATVWVVVLLLVGGVAVFYYVRNKSAKTNAKQWMGLEQASEVQQLSDFAEKNKGTIAARTARFQEARIRLQDGLTNLASPEYHGKAVTNLTTARDLYKQLETDSAGMPLLIQEAMYGRAKAEESLAGETAPPESVGKLSLALEYYQKLVKAYPDGLNSKPAAERIKELEDPEKKKKIQEFYDALAKSAQK